MRYIKEKDNIMYFNLLCNKQNMFIIIFVSIYVYDYVERSDHLDMDINV